MSAYRACRKQSVARVAKGLKTDYGQEEAIAVFGHDPRIYKTTVKEFHKDKNGNLKELTIVSLESKRTRRQAGS